MDDDRVEVNPYEVRNQTGKEIDYDKLIKLFGCDRIDQKLISRVQKLTGRKAHHLLRRGIFFSHRDLSLILDKYEKGQPFFLYTGRGPSSDSLHVGHLIPFIFTKYLQDAFEAPLVIQITDDQKYFHRGEGKSLQDFHGMAMQNIKDILAVGFDPAKTFIFLDSQYIGNMYHNVCLFQKHINLTTCKAIFGLDFAWNTGKAAFPAIQAAPCISTSFKHIFGDKLYSCLIPQGIDQDPYFRMARDVCTKTNLPKPACIHSKFIPSLQGFGTKMSSSCPQSSIIVTDTREAIIKKISGSVSGGQATKEEQEKLGADLTVDIAWQYLTIFLQDEAQLQRIGQEYKTGKIMSSVVKQKLSAVLWQLVSEHTARRNEISIAKIKEFLELRPLKFKFAQQMAQESFKEYNELLQLCEIQRIDWSLGMVFSALIVDSLVEDGQFTVKLSSLGELLLAQIYGLAKMKSLEQIEKVAHEYYHFFDKKKPLLLSEIEAKAFTVTGKIKKGINFAHVFKENTAKIPEFDIACNYCRVIPATAFLSPEQNQKFIVQDSQFTHSHLANRQGFLWFSKVLMNKYLTPVTDMAQELTKPGNSFNELMKSIEQINTEQSYGGIQRICKLGISHGTKVCLGGVLGSRLGFRKLPREMVSKFFNSKIKDTNKLQISQIHKQKLLERLSKRV